MNKGVENQKGNFVHTGEVRIYILYSFCIPLFDKEAIKQVKDNPMETQTVEEICLEHLFKISEVRRLEIDKEKYSL